MIVSYSIPTIRYVQGDPDPKGLPLIAFGVPLHANPDKLPRWAEAARRPIAAGDFAGRTLETALFYPAGDGPERLIAGGLGSGKDFEENTLIRRWATRIGREARRIGVNRYALVLPNNDKNMTSRMIAAAQGTVLGVCHGWKAPTRKRVEEVILHGSAPTEKGAEAVEAGLRLAEATLFGRSLIMEPANRLTPADLAETAKRIANEEDIAVGVLDEKKITAEGLHALAAVGRGSDNPPRLIFLEYEGSGVGGPSVVLVGKGITFDSGGLSLKSAERMVHMKYDMSGAAAVLSAIRGAARLRLPLRVIAVIPAAENLPGPHSYRPGDVIDTFRGLTVEVDNTDAEGRLVLADALAWAEKQFKPDEIIDIATLTGACKVALGRHAAGLFGSDDLIAERVIRAAEDCGERVWLMPLWEHYRKEIESDAADLKNVGNANVGGGAVVAASFLSHFIEKTQWAHIDIAGVAWADGDYDVGPKGPTGFGAALLLSYLRKRALR
ncbi:MAG: leucyl aminopeptidase [Candidatus Eisenbacteria bacterium]|nr:leucyl aminopeptidase [Candidatus Eisenbacteria bacterium]